MARSKESSKVKSRKAGRRGSQMSWNDNNINTVCQNQTSVSTPSPAVQADTISSRQLWQIIMRTQQVNLDLNLAEISAAWPTQPRPTILALEQQLANFRRHLRPGNSVVLRRGDINAAMSSLATANAHAHAAPTVNAHTHVFSINGGGNGNTTSDATAHAHPHTDIIPGVQGIAGPSNANGNDHHAITSDNAGWSSPPPLQIHRAKESQVPAASGEPPLGWGPAPEPPARPLELSRTASSRVVTRTYWPHPSLARRYLTYCDCGSLTCFYCYEKFMGQR
ncbi:hypothetical protein BDV27DRAFT_166499 [Aspergillus caelatus]|uniref:Uncharacterized protein n=1 Tax=Aspergillus caelatus TaxID=61420 RepID=A0A5N6ZYG9_9EURO|nr:uncharacterized protein BDV27DRAFT_166499 [Aspergillus caelatus]KAE8361979.1 hypothetical protein BDV27DRAFT_166499 [Aspergillus caelatus]